MRSTRKLSRFVAAMAGAVFHVVVLGDTGDPAGEAGAFRRGPGGSRDGGLRGPR